MVVDKKWIAIMSSSSSSASDAAAAAAATAGVGVAAVGADNNELVSVIVPAHNAEPWIEETLKSVVEQTYRPLELSIYNDGSVDGTARVVEEWVVGLD